MLGMHSVSHIHLCVSVDIESHQAKLIMELFIWGMVYRDTQLEITQMLLI